MNVSIKVSGLNELLAKVQQVPQRLRDRATFVVRDNCNQIAVRAKQEAPKDQGFLTGSISVKQNEDTSFSVVVQSAYAAYLEFGTKGNYVPQEGIDASEYKGGGTGEGFFQAILDWVHRKGIAGTYSVKTHRRTGSKKTQADQDKAAAWAIYRHILKYGVKAHPFFFKQMAVQAPQLKSDLQKMINEQRL